jgi:hypothetical protein
MPADTAMSSAMRCTRDALCSNAHVSNASRIDDRASVMRADGRTNAKTSRAVRRSVNASVFSSPARNRIPFAFKAVFSICEFAV